jgi:hypothetical protein
MCRPLCDCATSGLTQACLTNAVPHHTPERSSFATFQAGEVNFLQYTPLPGAYRAAHGCRSMAAIPRPSLGGDRAGQAGRAADGVASARGLRPQRVVRSGAVVRAPDVRGHGQLSPLLLRGLAGAAGRRAAGRRRATATTWGHPRPRVICARPRARVGAGHPPHPERAPAGRVIARAATAS